MDIPEVSQLRLAAKICDLLMELQSKDMGRWKAVLERSKVPFPYGDLAYAIAIEDWTQRGCPKQAFFSYAEDQVECPYLIEYRTEITEKFGLKICSQEEAKVELKKMTKPLIKHKVSDWGLN